MRKTYTHRIKAAQHSVYVTGFDEVKETAAKLMAQNNYGNVYEVIGGKHVLKWRFCPHSGLIAA